MDPRECMNHQQSPIMYNIVHHGNTSIQGHYISYVKGVDGFYKMDDEKVSAVPINEVKNEECYLLLYEKSQGMESSFELNADHPYTSAIVLPPATMTQLSSIKRPREQSPPISIGSDKRRKMTEGSISSVNLEFIPAFNECKTEIL